MREARERFLAERVAAHVHLQALSAILELQESGLAEVAHGDDPSGDPRTGGASASAGVVEPAEAGVHLAGALVRAEIVRIGSLPPARAGPRASAA